MTTKDPAIVAARAAYNAHKPLSQIWTWICSEIWAHPVYWTRYPDQHTRGLVIATGNGAGTYGVDVVAGEIVDAF